MEPGEGAIEYARTLTNGLTREEAAAVIRSLLADTSEDPRVKRCATCGYPFRDKTRPGNAETCGPTCKKARKTGQRAQQRKVKRLQNVTVKANKPVRYTWWMEYPYWIHERWMLNHAGSYERPYDPDKLAQIMAAKQRTEAMGGRRKAIQRVDYDGKTA